jgi:hypothetical protein
VLANINKLNRNLESLIAVRSIHFPAHNRAVHHLSPYPTVPFAACQIWLPYFHHYMQTQVERKREKIDDRCTLHADMFLIIDSLATNSALSRRSGRSSRM